MPKVADRKIGSKDRVICKVCTIASRYTEISRAQNLKDHLRAAHKDFIQLRSRLCNVQPDTAIKDTVSDHVVKDKDIPMNIINLYSKKFVINHLKCSTKDTSKSNKIHDGELNENEDSNLEILTNLTPVRLNQEVRSIVDSSELEGQSGDQYETYIEPEIVNADKDMEVEQNDNELQAETPMKQRQEKTVDQNIRNEGVFLETNEPAKTKSNKTNNKKALQMSFVGCLCCKRINDQTDFAMKFLKTLIKEAMQQDCKCDRKNNEKCCCEELLNNVTNNFKIDEHSERTEAADEIQHHFYTKLVNKEKRTFCFLCSEYSSLIGQKMDKDWCFKGWSSISLSRLNEAKKSHLQSKQHKISIERSNKRIETKLDNKFSDIEKAQCTKNMLYTAMFVICNYLSGRFFPELCVFILKLFNSSTISSKLQSPFGNRHLTTQGFKKATVALYKTAFNDIKKKLAKTFLPTGEKHKFMISADKGTARKDSARQVIICTYINSHGVPEEALLSAEKITDGTAFGAASHLETETANIIDTKNIAVMCTDGASVYTGCENGMVEQLKRNADFGEKIVYLPDLCHRAERLICKDKPDWVSETIVMSTFIVKEVNTHPKIEVALKNYAKASNKIFYALQPMCNTRYTEYAHIHIQSILKNFEILVDCLPSVIDQGEAAGDTAAVILKMITEPTFVGKLLLLDCVFVEFALAEKVAQSKDFGPFDFSKVTSKLKENIKGMKAYSLLNLKNFIDSGIFEFEFASKMGKCKVNVNLRKTQDDIGNWRHHNDSFEQIKLSFSRWVDIIIKHFDDYLGVPSSIKLANIVFNNGNADKLRLKSLKDLIKEINVEFTTCEEFCLGLKKCFCLESELNCFKQHFSCLEEKNKSSSMLDLLAYYLADKNYAEIQKLHIPNILKVIEIVQLLKASQSSTERTMSVIANHVKGKFEGRFKYGSSEIKYDSVLYRTFLTVNSSTNVIDFEEARSNFLKEGHMDSVMTNRPRSHHTKSIRAHLKRKTLGSKGLPKRKRPKIVSALDPLKYQDIVSSDNST